MRVPYQTDIPVNKTSIVAQLKHKPSGLVVRCQETRSLQQNRKIARRMLLERIDDLENGKNSRNALKKSAAMKKARSAQKKRNRKYRVVEEGAESA